MGRSCAEGRELEPPDPHGSVPFPGPPATKIHLGGLHPTGTASLQHQHGEGRLPGGLPPYFFNAAHLQDASAIWQWN